VELAEIEAALLELDEVKEAVVTTKENSQGNQLLVAYVVSAGRSVLSFSALRKTLAAKLPDYMIPSAFVALDNLPLAGPGKVNLRALPLPGRARADLASPFALPRNPTEEKLVAIWAELLGVDQVGIHDRFLELGGDSLLASRIICKVIELFHVEVPLRSLFDTPTVAYMAAVIDHAMATQSKPDVIERALAEVEGVSEAVAQGLLSKREK